MKRSFEVGDVAITKVLVEKLDGSVEPIDIRPQAVEIAIYEDINEPTVMVEIILSDAVNLVELFPIVGEERLTIVFNTPGVEQRTKYVFNIFSVESSVMNSQTSSSIYVLKGVTPVHFTNAVNFVEKSYRDSISNIATEVLEELIGSTSGFTKEVYVEPTKGSTPIIIPSSHPFQALDMLRQRAISATSKNGGNYLFFENQKYFNFRSLDNLINVSKQEQDTQYGRSYTYEPNSNRIRSTLNYRNILNFNYLTKFDSISKLIGGAFNTQVETFDILQKNASVVEFNLNNDKSLLPSLDKKLNLNNSSAFVSEYSSKNAVRFFNIKDTSNGENYINNFMPVSSAFSTLFDQNTVRVLIYGDSELKAGDVVNLKIPNAKGTTDPYTEDRYYSGSFLITRLRHNITLEDGVRNKHMISMDCVRIGVKDVV
jgi:hypothetical protein